MPTKIKLRISRQNLKLLILVFTISVFGSGFFTLKWLIGYFFADEETMQQRLMAATPDPTMRCDYRMSLLLDKLARLQFEHGRLPESIDTLAVLHEEVERDYRCPQGGHFILINNPQYTSCLCTVHGLCCGPATGAADYKDPLIREFERWSVSDKVDFEGLATIRTLLTGTLEINARNRFRRTPLMMSILNGWDDLAEQLINKGANIHMLDQNSMNALHFAAKYHKKELVTRLLKKGADCNQRDRFGRNALFYACGCWDYQRFCGLSKVDADSPLFKTYQAGQARYFENLRENSDEVEIVKALIKNGARVDDPDCDDRTPLFYASMDGYQNIVSLLTSKKVDVNHKDKNRLTPLFYTLFDYSPNTFNHLKDRMISSRECEIADILISQGANVNALYYDRPLITYVVERNYTEILRMLLTKKININAKGFTGTALEVAEKKGRTELAEILKQAGAKE
ncbi:MAG: ankyrin repeat domain-containing protein [Candidatus Wallbacteria bacterium]|nr:ankyrin repeat domain-containing protein [Candidatus Wallbacteria bacterium]